MKLWREFDSEQQLYVWGHMRPWERRTFKELEALARKTTGVGDLPSFSIELLKHCKNAAELDAAWRKIQDAFAEADQEIPDNVAATCDEMRSSMGSV
jgi:5-methylcytosine-specific restriction endonuclease McrBC GTP-binding regulatory subunit McrB